MEHRCSLKQEIFRMIPLTSLLPLHLSHCLPIIVRAESGRPLQELPDRDAVTRRRKQLLRTTNAQASASTFLRHDAVARVAEFRALCRVPACRLMGYSHCVRGSERTASKVPLFSKTRRAGAAFTKRAVGQTPIRRGSVTHSSIACEVIGRVGKAVRACTRVAQGEALPPRRFSLAA